MKTCFSVLIGLFLSVSVFGQKVIYTSVDNVNKAKADGIFNFELDKAYSIEKINKTKAYYTEYFTVTTKSIENGTSIQIKLIKETEMARRVIYRFFVSLDAKQIGIMGSPVPLDKFMEKFILTASK